MASGIVTRVVMNDFPKIIAGMESRAGIYVRKAAIDMEAAMKRRIVQQGAVDTGFLLNSVQASKVGRSHWRVVVGAEYGLYVDQGTRHMAARPFFFPAIGEVSPSFRAAMATIVEG